LPARRAFATLLPRTPLERFNVAAERASLSRRVAVRAPLSSGAAMRCIRLARRQAWRNSLLLHGSPPYRAGAVFDF